MKVKRLRDRNRKVDRRYIIAKDGSYIKDTKTGKKLDNIHINSSGYRVITLSLNGNYYNQIKISHLQHLTWKGKIPKGCIIHHKDEDKLNDHKDNHLCLTKSKHSKIHNTGKNNPMYGKTGEKSPFYRKYRSEETKKKIRESNIGKQSGKKHPMYGKHHSEESKKKIKLNHVDLSGKNNPSVKLTEKKVLKIRELYQKGIGTFLDLAEKYGVSKSCIQHIISRHTWTHI